MNKILKVSIIIINYNTNKETIECLKSIKKLNYKNFTVILIDNASKYFSELNEFIKKNKYDKLKFYKLKTNTGFTGGVNFGIKKALKEKIDYIWILNNDTLVDKNSLTELIKTSQNKNSAIVGAKIFSFNNKNKLESDGGKFNWITGSYPSGAIKNPKWITGASMFIKTDVFKNIGLFDKRFFLYYEDIDFCFRAIKKGFKLSVSEKALIWHKKSSSVKGLGKNIILYYHYRNLMLLTKKHSKIIIKQIIYLWGYFLILKHPFSKHIKLAITDFHNNKFGKFNH